MYDAAGISLTDFRLHIPDVPINICNKSYIIPIQGKKSVYMNCDSTSGYNGK